MKPEERQFKVVEINSCLQELEFLAKTYLNAARQIDRMLKPLEGAIKSNLAKGVPFSAIMRKIEHARELEESGLTIRYDAFRSYCYRHFREVIETARENGRDRQTNGDRPSISNSIEQRRRANSETREL